MSSNLDRNTEQPAPRARWTRLAALGLVFAGLGPLLMLLATVGWGLSLEEQLPFFGGTAAVAFIGAFLVWRFGTWSKVAGIVLALVVAGALFWTAFGLATPASFFDFVPGVLVMPGAILAIGACIAAIVAGRREHRSAVAEGGERMGIRIALAVVGILTVVSAVLTSTSRDTVAEETAEVVVFEDFEFDRVEYAFAPGSRILVRNTDPFLHTFTVDALGIDATLTPDSETLVEIPFEPGSYVVYCRPHTFDPEDPAEDDMAARLRVE